MRQTNLLSLSRPMRTRTYSAMPCPRPVPSGPHLGPARISPLLHLKRGTITRSINQPINEHRSIAPRPRPPRPAHFLHIHRLPSSTATRGTPTAAPPPPTPSTTSIFTTVAHHRCALLAAIPITAGVAGGIQHPEQ